MKTITLKRLELLNFKGIRQLAVDFATTGTTSISGANGTGKTTIFDAFTYVLFGKDSLGRKQFDIKTLDAAGQPLPRLPHEVRAVLDVDGEELTLCRRYNEIWRKKRGQAEEEFAGHAEERLYNDVPLNAKEYADKIAAICDEDTFKVITSPYYFTSLKPECQRATLINMAGGVSDEEVAAQRDDFRALAAQLTGKSLEEYRRELTVKKRPIKEQLEAIPQRIDERKRDLADLPDFDKIGQEIEQERAIAQELEGQLSDIAAAYEVQGAARAEKAQLLAQKREEATALQLRIADRELAQWRKQAAHRGLIENDIKQIEWKIEQTKARRPDVERRHTDCQVLRVKLIDDWKAVNARRLIFGDNDFTCPTCQRPLDPYAIEAKQAEMTAAFNKRKADELAEIDKNGHAVRDERDALAKTLQEIDAEVARLEDELRAKQQQLAALPDVQKPDTDTAVKDNTEYKAIEADIAALAAELSQPAAVPYDSDLKDELKVHKQRIEELTRELARRDVAQQNRQRIRTLEQEMKAQAMQLAEIERMEFTAQEFARARIEAVESKINAMFEIVRFKMFDRQINGGEVETCEATVDGVPYSSLNHAAQVNAGLDIIRALSRAAGTAAPVFIDNAEACNKLLPTAGQTVRLVVTQEPILNVLFN